jgi:tetratricopeptide (TPR) repeat protein
MGTVHRVHDTRDGRELALKRLILSEGKDETIAELFEREYHTLSELAHPRIIEVYDYGRDQGGAYYTMELLTGSDLRELGQIPWEKACALLRDLASSLAIVHSRRLIHADLSPRNVRCTADGRAKLLDFGAMMPMGMAQRMVGTPPFVAPELLHFASLDGRTDIYGLGALGYWLLTGHHAYPARDFSQLTERWALPIRSPRELRPEIPQAVSDLVMECLQLDRSARPRTAGIVMERLCAIASLPFEEQPDVAAAYLTTPTLVGRDGELAIVKDRLCAMSEGRGAVIVAEGSSGSGRSRFLSACVLEAKLLGRQVVRVDSGDSGDRGPVGYGAARSICNQLLALDSRAAERAARADASVLAHVLDPDRVGAEPCAPPPNGQKLLTALRDFVAAAARDRDLVIAVDDADRLDPESASLLVSLAQRAERRAQCLILTADAQGPGSGALDLLRRQAELLTLAPLTVEQTERLIQSVFGDVKHSVLLARRLHSVAAGNPRAILQLATHLVEQQIVRYEAGSFVLPERLLERDLPQSVSEALRGRFEGLEPDARELGSVLALTDPRELPVNSYADLTAHRDRARTFRATDRLIRAELLVPEGDRYRLGDATWRSVVESALTDEERRAYHARLAAMLEASGKVNRRAFHLMRGGDPEGAIHVLLAQYIKDPNEPRDPLEDYVPGILDLLEEVADAADALNIPAAYKVELRMKAIGASQFIGDVARFERLAPPLLERLKRESGLGDYEELSSLDPSERLPEAFKRVQARYEATPEHERGLTLFEAMREVARLCVMHAGVVGVALDNRILERVPDLAPLANLSPAIGAIKRMVDSQRLVMTARSLRARESLLSLIERLNEPDGAGLGELYNRSMRFGAAYLVGLIEAGMGLPEAGQRVKDMESVPGHRVNAQRVHVTAHLMRGDVEEAAVAQRRAELVLLQDGQHIRYPGTTARTELSVYAMLEDLGALKEVTERLAQIARTYPNWSVFADVGRYHYRRIQGDFQGALEALKPLLSIRPLEHREWPSIAAAHVQALVDLGKYDEALLLGREYFDVCKRQDLVPGRWYVSQATAAALLGAGRPREAVAVVEELIEEAHRWNVRGLMLGTLYELRARVAIAEGNEGDFTRFAELCREQYRPDRVPALAAKFQRLLRAAERSGVTQTHSPTASVTDAELVTLHTLVTTAHSRLMECENTKTRAECILKILTEQLAPKAAYLYGVTDGVVQLLGAVPRKQPPAGLNDLIQEFLESELDLDGRTMTGFVEEDLLDNGAAGFQNYMQKTAKLAGPRLLSHGGTHIQPITLIGSKNGELQIAGIAALQVKSLAVAAPPAVLLEVLAKALLANDNATVVASQL